MKRKKRNFVAYIMVILMALTSFAISPYAVLGETDEGHSEGSQIFSSIDEFVTHPGHDGSETFVLCPKCVELGSEPGSPVVFDCIDCLVARREVPQLDAPEISITEHWLTWAPINGAHGYSIYSNGEMVIEWSSPLFTQNFIFNLLDIYLPNGEHVIQVRANGWRGATTGWYVPPRSSELSNPVTYVVSNGNLTQLDAPEISISGHVVTWEPVNGARAYSVYANGEMVFAWFPHISTQQINLQELHLPNGTHVIQVRANAWYGATDLWRGTRCSELSNPVTYVQNTPQLTPPTIELDGSKLTWTDIDNKAGVLHISVKPANTIMARPPGQSHWWAEVCPSQPGFDLRFLDLPSGTYSVQAMVGSTWESPLDGHLSNSDFSNTVIFVHDGKNDVPRFPVPSFSIEGTVLTVNPSEGARWHALYINGVQRMWFEDSVDINSLWWWIFTSSPVERLVQIRTIGMWGIALESELSEPVTIDVDILCHWCSNPKDDCICDIWGIICGGCGNYVEECICHYIGEATLSISSVSALAGQEVNVTIDLTGNPGFALMPLMISFPEELTLVKYEVGENFANGFTGPEGTSPGQRIPGGISDNVYMNWMRTSNYIGDGTLITLTFEVCPDAVDGDYVINAFFKDILGYYNPRDNKGQNVAIAINSGRVSVGFLRTLGDVSGNGVVDMFDAILVARYLAGHLNLDALPGVTNFDISYGKVTAESIALGRIGLMDAITIAMYATGLPSELCRNN